MEHISVARPLETGFVTVAQELQLPKFVVSSGLLAVLKMEGAQGELFTKKEILGYLRAYILKRVLYDSENPTLIHCENDPLGYALGVKQFTVNDTMPLLSTKVRLATPQQMGHVANRATLNNVNVGEKRKSSDHEDEPSLKKHCPLDGTNSKPPMARSPIIFKIDEFPDYDSSPETVLSVQGYETAFAKDSTSSSDDLWFLETEEEYEVEIEANGFEVEYEVNSLANSSGPDDDDDSDTESDVAEMEMVGAAILVCQNDSDVEFWADTDSDSESVSGVEEQSTSESDPEITDSDKWQCVGCQAFNRPFARFCQKCWQLRSDWLPARRPKRNNQKRRRRLAVLRRTSSEPVKGLERDGRREFANSRHRKMSQSMFDIPIVDEEIGSDGDVVSSTPPDAKVDVEEDKLEDVVNEDRLTDPSADDACNPSAGASNGSASLCSICLSRPKNASIVHGKIGHQMCCYTCGKKLWARNKPCPICRRTIQKVIHNYIV